ncbi:MAG: glucosyltransferase domain-containing protein [Lachnospiraceae bacterium]|nr:glucosyltransferase domain-containing protein [Lachnospiraceae bacterium]
MQGIKLQKLKDILLYSVILWMVAHGYRFMNNLYTADTLASVFQDDILWQRSLGRFMQTFTMIFRGCIVSPWLLAVISVVIFSFSVYLVSELLQIEDKILLFTVCAVLSCNVTITCALAAYTPWIDIYMTAFFFAVLGVYLFTKDKLICYILGMVSLAVSMGFYQMYICAAFMLFAIIYIRELSEKKPDRAFWIKTGKTVGGVILSGGLYYALYKLVLVVHHVTEAMSYNSLANMGGGEGPGLGSLLAGTYERYVYYMTHQGTFVSTYLLGRKVSDAWDVLIIICVIAVVLIFLAGLAVINKKNKTSMLQKVLQAVLILCIPLFSNVVYVFANGFEYELMIFGIYFLYVLLAVILAKVIETKKMLLIALIPVFIIVWHSVVFSNQVYMKIDMEDREALSICTRIADDVCETEGYKPGITPVKVVGALEQNEHHGPVIYLSDVHIHGNYNTPFNYTRSFPFYMNYYLNEDMNFTTQDVSEEITDTMPEYPEEGSIAFVDDVLVIKLSD